jgi:hypothetical protein
LSTYNISTVVGCIIFDIFVEQLCYPQYISPTHSKYCKLLLRDVANMMGKSGTRTEFTESVETSLGKSLDSDRRSPNESALCSDVSQFSVRYKYVFFGTPDQGQTLDVYRSDL